MRRIFLAMVAVAGLSACEQSVKAPFDKGVCYSVNLPDDGGEPKFNVVARDQPQMEFCAARLEEMRQRFLGLGGSNREVIGSYQGQFIFVERQGVSTGKTLDGIRFFALTRTGDGRLAVPGTIERQIEAPGPRTPPAAPASGG